MRAKARVVDKGAYHDRAFLAATDDTAAIEEAAQPFEDALRSRMWAEGLR